MLVYYIHWFIRDESMTENQSKENSQNASGAWHRTTWLYIWNFTSGVSWCLSPSWIREAGRTESGDTGRPGYAEGEGRKGLLTQSLEYTRTAKRAAGERALCVLRHPRPFAPSQPRSRDRSMIPPSALRRDRRRWTCCEYPNHPLHGAVARQPRERGRRVFRRFAMLSRPSPPVPLRPHAPQLSSAARAIMRAQLSAFMTVDTLLFYS